AAMAQAMGIQNVRIRQPNDLLTLDFNAICNHPGPTLFDVYIDLEEVPPMGARVKVLGNH
ncbi:MAG: hypothetical protein Q9N68_03715, partial [Gammaproteobacteria bacterium]|nr:hypothetical protein [Gammaproteobacteria bacterium]